MEYKATKWTQLKRIFVSSMKQLHNQCDNLLVLTALIDSIPKASDLRLAVHCWKSNYGRSR